MDGGSGSYGESGLRTTKAVRIEFDTLSVNGRIARGASDDRAFLAGRTLRLLVGSGRGSVLQGSSTLPLILLPLRGGVRIADGESVRMLRAGELSVTEPGQCLHAVGSGDALWIAFVAPLQVWQQLFEATMETPNPEPLLLPAVHPANRAIRRAALRAGREARRSTGGSLEKTPALLRFAILLADLQASFDPLIGRCPGRSLSQRRGVFLRLKRAYDGMEASGTRGLTIGEFARIANYSPCHFVRTFSAVFGQTPHTVLVEQRLQRARRLVNETHLSITEVARASGFEDRCAFARSFKQRFGVTATATRRFAQAEAVL